MSDDLLDMMENLEAMSPEEDDTRDRIIRAPFNYPGGKSRSVSEIIKHLPYRGSYIEPFGGSGAVLLSRKSSKLEVFNDRFAGVVAFYRCVRDSVKLARLCELLRHTVHSREDFIWCKETWQNVEDDVERAARWYYMVCYSFGGLGRNFGRATSPQGAMAGKLLNRLPEFYPLHDRLKNVQIENQDYAQCMRDYDNPGAVFYCDPPYVDASKGIYKFELTQEEHKRFIELVFNMQGFVAVSGYANPLYDNQEWDERVEWDSFVSIQSLSYVNNGKENLKGLEARKDAKEVLWIKEAC